MSAGIKTSSLTSIYHPLIAELVSPAESCGLCERGMGDTFWPTDESRWAHKSCVQKITPAVNQLLNTIELLFQGEQRRQARIYAVQQVKRLCKPMTITEYLEKNGAEKASRLFNTIGISAVKSLAETQNAMGVKRAKV